MRKITLILLSLMMAVNFSFAQKGMTFQTRAEKIAYDEANSPVVSAVQQEENYPDRNSASRGDMILEEHFDTGFPALWSQQANATGIWEWTDTYPGWGDPLINSDQHMVMCDSDGHSSDVYDVYLMSPVMDLSAYDFISIEFDRNFQAIGSSDDAGVYIGNSTDGWTPLWESNSDDPSGGVHAYYEVDVSTLADPTTIQVSFYYSTNGGTWHWGFMLDNVVIQEIDPSIDGYVLNGSGQTIAGATVEITTNGRTATTNATGYYVFYGIPDGTYEMVASREGYNTSDPVTVTVTSGTVTSQDFTLTAPNITVTPLIFDETLHPNEYLTTYLGLLNTGDGPWNWAAWVVYPTTAAPSYPHYGMNQSDITFGQVNDVNAFTRKGAHDVVNNQGSRAVGDILDQFSISGLGMTWGSGFDGTYMYLTDPVSNPTTIYQFNTDGTATGTTFTVNVGQNWIADMASDGTYLYALMVGGPNNIQVIDIATGNVVNTIGGSWTSVSQRGLAYDALADEFYVGGWNTDNIYRLDASGNVLSQTSFGAVSGLTWHPQGGPDGTGSLWVMINASTSTCTEVDPNNGWAPLQGFNQPGDNSYGGAGLALNSDGNLWIPNMNENVVYLVDTEEPLSGGPSGWLTLSDYSGTIVGGGGSFNIGVNFDASGTAAGEVYTADIFINSSPNVGIIDVPVTMTIAGEEFPVLTGFTAELTNEITGEVSMSWNNFRDVDATLEYYKIYRNGAVLTTVDPGVNSYVDVLPGFGTYDYYIQPIFLEGDGVPSDVVTIYWYAPELCYNDTAENTQFPDQEQSVVVELENCADDGILYFEFPDYLNESRDLTGEYQVEMFDSWGDGWNGNSLDLYVDGVFAGTAELLSGSGPGYFSFTVTNGAEITGTWNYGSYSSECSYNILDTEGNVVYSGTAGDIPAATLYAVVPADFVVAVQPASGTINAGQTLNVTLTYSSMGYPGGDYIQDITLVTNEPDAPREQTHVIHNTMHVIEPEYITGTVTDCNTGLPLENVTITANVLVRDIPDVFYAETGEDGTYTLAVEPGNDYVVTAEKPGYQTETTSVNAVDLPAVRDFALCEEPYPVSFVLADPNQDDTECMVTWSYRWARIW
jgi:hypothetical protein